MLAESKMIFLDTLSFILNEKKYSNCITWLSNGRSFVINNIEKFRLEVLPEFFKHNNFSSFHRQLNLYGFTRDMSNKIKKVFSHPKFLRGRPELLDQIKKMDSIILYENVYNQNQINASKIKFLTRAVENIKNDHQQSILKNNEVRKQIIKVNKMIMFIFHWVKNNPKWIEFSKMKENHKKSADVESLDSSMCTETNNSDNIILF